MSFKVCWEKTALKQLKNLKSAGLKKDLDCIISILEENPFKNPPEYEKLNSGTKNKYSRRLNKKHRVVYQVYKDLKSVKIISVWSHYEY